MPDLIDQARSLAARHFTRNAMAVDLGLTCSQVDRLLRVNNITTTGKRGVKPMDDAPAIHGCGGQKPAKLMPSAQALARASIWSFAGGVGHVSTLPVRATQEENQALRRVLMGAK